MGIFDFLRPKEEKVKMKYVSMMNGSVPVFSSFGDNVYASDIVQGCIRCIANSVGKLQPKHIRTDKDGMQIPVNGSINRLLRFKPNEFMTTTDFLEKITYLREINKNVFIYPTYKQSILPDGTIKKEYTGLYPLNPVTTEFVEDAKGKMFVRFTFLNGYDTTLPYNELIHWRKDFSANDLMGGDALGRADNKSLLSLLNSDNTAVQSIDKAVKSSFGIKGIVKMNTFLDDDKQKAEMQVFEEKIASSGSGILPMDMKSDFIPVNINPKAVEPETMKFITERILNNYGVPLAVFNGDFTEEQYQSFYEKTLEGIIISLGRCFSKTLFTDRELEFGNEIIFYNQGLNYTSMANKIQAVDILSSRGTMTDNQILAVFGYPPFEGGNIRKQSLNYINRELADAYQMKSSTGKEVS